MYSLPFSTAGSNEFEYLVKTADSAVVGRFYQYSKLFSDLTVENNLDKLYFGEKEYGFHFQFKILWLQGIIIKMAENAYLLIAKISCCTTFYAPLLIEKNGFFSNPCHLFRHFCPPIPIFQLV